MKPHFASDTFTGARTAPSKSANLAAPQDESKAGARPPPGAIRDAEALRNFHLLPDCANVRLPVVTGLMQVHAATIYRWEKLGLFPVRRKISPKSSAWNVGELRAALAVKEAV